MVDESGVALCAAAAVAAQIAGRATQRSAVSGTRRRLTVSGSRSPYPAMPRRRAADSSGSDDDGFMVRAFDAADGDIGGLCDDMEILHDGERRVTEHGKISMLIRHCDDPDVRELVQDVRTNGVEDAIGDHHDWPQVTWEMVRFRLEEMFGSSNREDRAVAQLLSRGDNGHSQQNCRVPILNKRLVRMHRDAKDNLDLESTSKLQRERYGETLCDSFVDEMADCVLETPQQFVLGRIETNEDKKLKHSMRSGEEQDARCAREARRRGLGNVYWESTTKKKGSKKKTIKKSSINAIGQDDDRMDRLEKEVAEQKGSITKIQVDLHSGLELLKTDFTQKLTVVETKTDHCTTLQEKTIALLEQQNSQQQQNTTQQSQWPPAANGYQQQSYGKGSKGKGYLLRRCYGCGGKGHIVRNCPQASNPQQGGWIRRNDGQKTSINAVAMDLIAAVNHYGRGGIKDLPVEQLHEQMDDPDVEMSQADICYIALDFASGLMSSLCEECESAADEPQSAHDWHR